MKRHRNLKVFTAFGGAALIIWLAFVFNNPFWWGSLAVFVLAVAGWRSVLAHKRRRFDDQRRIVMEQVERLFSSLTFYDEVDFLDRYSRFRFQTAINHAAILGHALKAWVMDMQKRFDDNDMPRTGLQLTDVPALVESTCSQVVEAFKFVKDGIKGDTPAILKDDWFDPVTIFGVDVRVFRTVEEENVFRPDYMKKPTPASRRSSAIVPVTGSRALATTIDAQATEVVPPAEPRQLSYQPGHDGPVVNLAFGTRTHVEVAGGQPEDLNKVVPLDQSRRKAKR